VDLTATYCQRNHDNLTPRHEGVFAAQINMTGSPPQPGDSDTHDNSTESKTTADRAPNRGSRAGAEGTPTPVVRESDREQSSGDESGTGEEEEEEEDGDGDNDEDEEGDDDDDDEEEEEEEDEEPKLKYARLTQHLGPVYRNGDATSAFFVGGDKMAWKRPSPSPHPVHQDC